MDLALFSFYSGVGVGHDSAYRWWQRASVGHRGPPWKPRPVGSVSGEEGERAVRQGSPPGAGELLPRPRNPPQQTQFDFTQQLVTY